MNHTLGRRIIKGRFKFGVNEFQFLLYAFLASAVTNYETFNDLKQHTFVPL